MSFVTVGADPELFGITESGVPTSVIGKIPGSKWEPFPVLESLGKGYSIQVDNVAMEYGVPPAKDENQFIDHISIMTEECKRILRTIGLRASTAASLTFGAEEIASPEAKVFGCEPDYNAWTLAMNSRPIPPSEGFRSAGGHIHIGVDCGDDVKVGIVRGLDAVVGTWLALHDPDKEREKLYGQPGAMRFKEYGLEWRRPSNFWTFQSEEFRKELYLRLMYVVDTTIAQSPDWWTKKMKFGPEMFDDEVAMKHYAGLFHA